MFLLPFRASLAHVTLASVCCLLLCQGQACKANGQSTPPSASVTAALDAMLAEADAVFAGQVESVDREDAIGYVDVRFQVRAAVRGCKGDVYTLREWAGLWSGPDPRYQVGGRYLMLVRPSGSSGLGSPVAGRAGIIPLFPSVSAPVMASDGTLPPDDVTATGDWLNGLQVDLRWVRTELLRGASGSGVSSDVAESLHNRHIEAPLSNQAGELEGTPVIGAGGGPVADPILGVGDSQTWSAVAPMAPGGPAAGQASSAEPTLGMVLALVGLGTGAGASSTVAGLQVVPSWSASGGQIERQTSQQVAGRWSLGQSSGGLIDALR